MRESNKATICVGATVEPGLPFHRETMHALPDPADLSQAVIQNVPFFIDGLNFGDIVRVGEPDEAGVHPIKAVVEASGHRRFLFFLEGQPVEDLLHRMGALFHEYALRIESGIDELVSVSMHPDLDADDVAEALLDWMAEHAPDDQDLWNAAAYYIGEPIETVVGPLRSRSSWTRRAAE